MGYLALKKKPKNINNLISSYVLVIAILIFWEFCSDFGLVSKYKLPAPSDIVMAFINDFSLMMNHAKYTILEAIIGLSLGVLTAFILSIVMDQNEFFKNSVYPIIIVTQTIPSVAIAPLLVLWLGFDMLPKIILIILGTFFPIIINLLDAYASVENENLMLFKSMGASEAQIFWHLKLPSAATGFFSGLKISISYSIIAAVVAEWIGGFHGLGVYMTRVRRSYAFDKMFAVIFFISLLSLIAIGAISAMERKVVKWK